MTRKYAWAPQTICVIIARVCNHDCKKQNREFPYTDTTRKIDMKIQYITGFVFCILVLTFPTFHHIKDKLAILSASVCPKHHTKITTQQNVQAKPGEVRLWLHDQRRQRSGLDQRWLLRNENEYVTKYQGQPQQSGIISRKQHFQQYMGSLKIKFKELMRLIAAKAAPAVSQDSDFYVDEEPKVWFGRRVGILNPIQF